MWLDLKILKYLTLKFQDITSNLISLDVFISTTILTPQQDFTQTKEVPLNF